MQDFASSVREHVKNTGTKPVQPISLDRVFWSHHKRKNPGSAATETGIKSIMKACGLHLHDTSKRAIKAISNQLTDPVVEISA